MLWAELTPQHVAVRADADARQRAVDQLPRAARRVRRVRAEAHVDLARAVHSPHGAVRADADVHGRAVDLAPPRAARVAGVRALAHVDAVRAVDSNT
jgi:hypothetical protein